LAALKNQSLKSFEVIVINDGEDQNTARIVSYFEKDLKISYFSRPNDKCVSRSRNLGCQKSLVDNLVFIDSDILLNSRALANYQKILTENDRISVWGKIVEKKENNELIDDERLVFKNEEIRNYLEKPGLDHLFWFKPYFQSWGGNFGINKKTYLEIGGFNESFIGWGHEDVEFPLRLYRKQVKFRFSASVEGIHLGEQNHKVDYYYDPNYAKTNEEVINQLLIEDCSAFMSLSEKEIKAKIEEDLPFLAKDQALLAKLLKKIF